jgi:hypothetical protein
MSTIRGRVRLWTGRRKLADRSAKVVFLTTDRRLRQPVVSTGRQSRARKISTGVKYNLRGTICALVFFKMAKYTILPAKHGTTYMRSNNKQHQKEEAKNK